MPPRPVVVHLRVAAAAACPLDTPALQPPRYGHAFGDFHAYAFDSRAGGRLRLRWNTFLHALGFSSISLYVSIRLWRIWPGMGVGDIALATAVAKRLRIRADSKKGVMWCVADL